MNIGVLTSGFFHTLFGVLLIINIENMLIQKKEVIKSVKVALISETDYTKLISEEKIEKSEPLHIGGFEFSNPLVEKKHSKIVIAEKIRPVGNELSGLTEPNIKEIYHDQFPKPIPAYFIPMAKEALMKPIPMTPCII